MTTMRPKPAPNVDQALYSGRYELEATHGEKRRIKALELACSRAAEGRAATDIVTAAEAFEAYLKGPVEAELAPSASEA